MSTRIKAYAFILASELTYLTFRVLYFVCGRVSCVTNITALVHVGTNVAPQPTVYTETTRTQDTKCRASPHVAQKQVARCLHVSVANTYVRLALQHNINVK